MKKLIFSILFLCVPVLVFAQGNSYRNKVRPTQNVILMIPDGTSLSVISAARWYKIHNNLGRNLNIDPFISGTVQHFNSNSPIPCSAPAASAFMTGVAPQAHQLSIYPPADPENDIFPVNPDRAYQPLATILEAAKIDLGMSVGIVVTCHFVHATPAAAAAHHYSRNNYALIAQQMAYQNLDLLFGGGTRHLSERMRTHLERNNTTIIEDDIEAFRRFESGKLWALWHPVAMPYELDRNPVITPSLEEMTVRAIELLSQNENGFFLLVEGSMVDWLAHANDAGGMIAEFLAFDRAVGAALEFAKADGNTTVIIASDHGNSGFSIGREGMNFDEASLSNLFEPVSRFRRTATGMNSIIRNTAPENLKSVMYEYTGIEISYPELMQIVTARGFEGGGNFPTDTSRTLLSTLTDIMNSRTLFGFTTTGHTGEEVILAAFHPQGDIPMGMHFAPEINHYLVDVLGLPRPLDELTQEIFAKHTEVFAGINHRIMQDSDGNFVLEVRNRRNTLRVPAHSSVAYLNGTPFDLGSVAIHFDRTGLFYLPRNLAERLR